MIWLWWAEFLGLVFLAPVALGCALQGRTGFWGRRWVFYILAGAWVLFWVGGAIGLVIAPRFWEQWPIGNGVWGWATCRAWRQGWSFAGPVIAGAGVWTAMWARRKGVRADRLAWTMAAMLALMPMTLCELEAQAAVVVQQLRLEATKARDDCLGTPTDGSQRALAAAMQSAWEEAQKLRQVEAGKPKDRRDDYASDTRLWLVHQAWLNGRPNLRTSDRKAFERWHHALRMAEIISKFGVLERIFLLMPFGEWTDLERCLREQPGYPFDTHGIGRLTLMPDAGTEVIRVCTRDFGAAADGSPRHLQPNAIPLQPQAQEGAT